MIEETYKIGELAQLLGLSVRTLHHYDHIGLLIPSGSTEAGHRLYSNSDIRRLQQILSMRQIGFSLDEIKQIMDDQSMSPLQVTRMHLERVRENILNQIKLLRHLEAIEQRLVSHREVALEQFIDTIEAIIMSEQKSTINLNRTVPILDVSNYEASMEYYCCKLGFRKNWEWGDPASFGSVVRDQVELFITETPEGPFGTSTNIFVKNVEALYVEFQRSGANITMPPKQMVYGVRELRVEDPDGHILRFTQNLPEEDLVVERVAIQPRIERRLASMLEELAVETGRSLGQLVEEIVLHSFEPVPGAEGQASASPHSLDTYEIIDRLKDKHRIDYGTHDSYRFKESN